MSASYLRFFQVTVHGLSNIGSVDCIVVRVLTVVIFLNHHCIKGKKTPNLIANGRHLQAQKPQQLCISHLPYSCGYHLTVQFRDDNYFITHMNTTVTNSFETFKMRRYSCQIYKIIFFFSFKMSVSLCQTPLTVVYFKKNFLVK